MGTTTFTCTSTRCLSVDPISGHKNLDLGRFFKVEFRLKSSNCYFKDAGFRTVRYHYGIANPPVDPQLDFNDSRALQPTVGEKDMLRWGESSSFVHTRKPDFQDGNSHAHIQYSLPEVVGGGESGGRLSSGGFLIQVPIARSQELDI